MQVGIDVTCMHTDFGGHGLSSFGNIATLKNGQKCKKGLMSYACAPILVGVVSPVLEILLLSKTAKFPFPTMDYSPWSSKNLIDWNQLKKFIQIGIDVTCIHTDFGERGLSSFGDIATLKNGHFSLSDHGL